MSALRTTKPDRVTANGSVSSSSTIRGAASAESCDRRRNVVPAGPSRCASAAIIAAGGKARRSSRRFRIRGQLRCWRRVPGSRILPPATVCGGDASRSTTCSPAGRSCAGLGKPSRRVLLPGRQRRNSQRQRTLRDWGLRCAEKGRSVPSRLLRTGLRPYEEYRQSLTVTVFTSV